jgi:hypothetical protein
MTERLVIESAVMGGLSLTRGLSVRKVKPAGSDHDRPDRLALSRDCEAGRRWHGVVFKPEDTRLHRFVALKFLRTMSSETPTL